MARRAAYITNYIESDTASTLVLECGDMIGAKGKLEEIKTQYLLESYRLMGMDCLNLGSSDLLLGQNFLLQATKAAGIPILSANVYYADIPQRFLSPYIIKRIGGKRFMGIEWGGVKVGIFGVVSMIEEASSLPWNRDVDEHRLIIKDPATVSREIIEELRPKVDVLICMSHTGWLQARELARGLTGIDVMIVGNGVNVKTKPYMVNNIPLVMSGEQGKYLGILEIILDDNRKIEEVNGRSKPLDAKAHEHPAILEMIARYNEELQKRGTELSPITSQLDVIRFVGHEACGRCHKQEYGMWKKTAHAHAVETLKKADQDNNPNCLLCHVTGYGHFNGFHSFEKTPGMTDVQCETCHGSGSDHVRFVRGDSVEDCERPSDNSYLSAPTEDRCIACHTGKQDPTFDYEKDVKLINHKPIETAE